MSAGYWPFLNSRRGKWLEWGTSGIVSKKVLNYIGVDSLDKEYGFTFKRLVYHWKFKPAIQQFAELVSIG